MDRLRRISAVWDWLPAFRAVAELEHVGRAAERLHVSPSSLSRTVKLLESELGRPLFERRGRGIQRNDAGELLLRHVRDATRWIDEALESLEDSQGPSVLRLGAIGVAAQVHVPRLIARLLAARPTLCPHVTTPDASSIADDLTQGRLDLVLCSTPIAGPSLTVVSLARVTNGIYCGPDHPLHDRRSPRRDEILAHPFVAPPTDARGVTGEGWPPGVPRIVAARLDRMRAGLEACSRGAVLAVLPDVLARQSPIPLRRLDGIALDDTEVHAIHRTPLGDPASTGGPGGMLRVEELVALLREIDAEIAETTS